MIFLIFQEIHPLLWCGILILLSRSDEKYTDTSWQDIRVGDIVRLACDEVIPADIVILKSSDLSCSCYIDTANLDGESNLKQRESVKGLPFQVRYHSEWNIVHWKF